MKNPFTRIVAAIRSRKNDTDRGLRRMFGATDPGVFVDYDTAYQVSAVWACIDAIAAPLASSDWNVYEGLRDEANKKALPNDNLQYILNTRWNVEMTAQSAKRMMGISAVGCGNGYAEIERDLAGRIVALWPIPPDRVEPRRDLQTGDLFYRVTLGDQGGHVDLPPEDVLHFRGPGLSGFMGDDVLHRAIKTIAQAVAMDRFTAA
jgi:HK97 family phage portal protein